MGFGIGILITGGNFVGGTQDDDFSKGKIGRSFTICSGIVLGIVMFVFVFSCFRLSLSYAFLFLRGPW